jgi:enoyl-CoA hydratase
LSAGRIVVIELEERGVVTILRMASGSGNALNLEFTRALDNCLQQLERGPAKAIVLTGNAKMFGAGVDLPALVSGGPDYVRRFVPAMIATFERLACFSKPLVAAINGHAIAGGTIILLACDQRILARGKARLGLTEIRVGVEFPAWALEIARFRTPPEHFDSLILTGHTWLPEEALSRGLVDELVDPERLMERACEVASDLAAIPTGTYAATKITVRRPLVESARRQSAIEKDTLLAQWSAPETLRAIAEFAARNIGRRAE